MRRVHVGNDRRPILGAAVRSHYRARWTGVVVEVLESGCVRALRLFDRNGNAFRKPSLSMVLSIGWLEVLTGAEGAKALPLVHTIRRLREQRPQFAPYHILIERVPMHLLRAEVCERRPHERDPRFLHERRGDHGKQRLFVHVVSLAVGDEMAMV